jgi:hypothetical protein
MTLFKTGISGIARTAACSGAGAASCDIKDCAHPEDCTLPAQNEDSPTVTKRKTMTAQAGQRQAS